MPRTKKSAQPAQTDIEDAIAALTPEQQAKKDLVDKLRTKTPADLIKEYREIDTWMDGETKRLTDFLAPYRLKTKTINDVLLEKANAEKVNSFSTDFGTAYISQGISTKVDPNAPAWTNDRGEQVTGREALLDWALQFWEEYGAEHITVNISGDGVKAYQAATKSEQYPEGLLPPGISAERWRRLQIRKA